MPQWFPRQDQLISRFNQSAPAKGNLRFLEQSFWQNEKKKIRAAIANQALEFCAIEETILQRTQLPEDAGITAMVDSSKVV